MKTQRSRPARLALPLAALLVSHLLSQPALPADFTNGPAMLTPRVLHTATLLQNGKVLVVGGIVTNRPAVPTASA